MSFWSGLRAAIFGSPKVVQDVFDKDDGLLVKAGRWVDGLHYSEQEKAATLAAMAKGVQDFVAATLGENTERSRTRRSLAILWIRYQLLILTAGIVVYPMDENYAKFILDIAMGTLMITGTLSVIAFFFGAYAWGAHIKKDPADKGTQ